MDIGVQLQTGVNYIHDLVQSSREDVRPNASLKYWIGGSNDCGGSSWWRAVLA